MSKKTVTVIVIASILAVAITLLHYIPIPKDVSFSMDGSIRSADGDVIKPCTMTYNGNEVYFIFQNKRNELRGKLYLIDESRTIYSYMALYFDPLPNSPDTPGGKLNFATGKLYRGEALGFFPCSVYFTDDRSTYIILYSGKIYCVSSLSEAEFMEVFRAVGQHAEFAG